MFSELCLYLQVLKIPSSHYRHQQHKNMFKFGIRNKQNKLLSELPVFIMTQRSGINEAYRASNLTKLFLYDKLFPECLCSLLFWLSVMCFSDLKHWKENKNVILSSLSERCSGKVKRVNFFIFQQPWWVSLSKTPFYSIQFYFILF